MYNNPPYKAQFGILTFPTKGKNKNNTAKLNSLNTSLFSTRIPEKTLMEKLRKIMPVIANDILFRPSNLKSPIKMSRRIGKIPCTNCPNILVWGKNNAIHNANAMTKLLERSFLTIIRND